MFAEPIDLTVTLDKTIADLQQHLENSAQHLPGQQGVLQEPNVEESKPQDPSVVAILTHFRNHEFSQVLVVAAGKELGKFDYKYQGDEGSVRLAVALSQYKVLGVHFWLEKNWIAFVEEMKNVPWGPKYQQIDLNIPHKKAWELESAFFNNAVASIRKKMKETEQGQDRVVKFKDDFDKYTAFQILKYLHQNGELNSAAYLASLNQLNVAKEDQRTFAKVERQKIYFDKNYLTAYGKQRYYARRLGWKCTKLSGQIAWGGLVGAGITLALVVFSNLMLPIWIGIVTHQPSMLITWILSCLSMPAMVLVGALIASAALLIAAAIFEATHFIPGVGFLAKNILNFTEANAFIKANNEVAEHQDREAAPLVEPAEQAPKKWGQPKEFKFGHVKTPSSSLNLFKTANNSAEIFEGDSPVVSLVPACG